MVDQHTKHLGESKTRWRDRPPSLVTGKVVNFSFWGAIMLTCLGACGPTATSKVTKDNDSVKVLSKADLTSFTSVYLIEVGGNYYVVVNGESKCAIARHN